MTTDDDHGAAVPPLGRGATCGASATRRWRTSNDALARLLARHRPVLTDAVVMARRIRHAVEDLVPAMTALCRRACRFCPEPCCITNTVWFDFRDLLVLHLLGEAVPSRQAAADPGEDCPYLGGRGCTLPWSIRPWMCVKYMCPTHLGILESGGWPQPAALWNRIDSIENQRLQMETEVLDRVKRRRRRDVRPSAY